MTQSSENHGDTSRGIAVFMAMGILAFLGITGIRAAETNFSDVWAQMPQILQRIVPPKFPEREFDITKFGAVGDGTNLCTKAFADAISACHKAGGGKIIVPEGRFLTGPIHLESNIELRVEKNAEIIFSDRFEDYLPTVFVRVGGIEMYNYSPLIYARGCENVAVTGLGHLNGNGKRWWDWKGKEAVAAFDMAARGVPVEQRVFGTTNAAIRPSFVCFVNCTNVLLEDFTIGSGPNWTIHPVYCQNVTIREVNVDTDGPNNDGIDPDSCRDVLVEHCTFSTGDDCVVLKSGYNEDGWRVGRPTENVIMRFCSSKRGHGGLVVGSEMSGDVRNVFMYECEFDGTDRAVRIKSRRGRGGMVENIFVRDVKAKNLKHEIVILKMDYSSDTNNAATERAPIFRNMAFKNITCEGAPTAVLISGLEDSPIENVSFEDLNLTSKKGVVCSDVKNVIFKGAVFKTGSGPVFDLNDASEFTIRGVKSRGASGTFLKVSGAGSKEIHVFDSDLTAKEQVVIGKEAAADAVEFR